MSSLVHEFCLRVVLILWTVIHFQRSSCQNLLYGSRLGTFPKPDFRTNFTLSANRGAMSFREIRHDLNVDPFYVRVYARPKDGQNSGFCFTGIGSSQSSPSRSSYGGLIYAYNSEFVRIWAPTNQNGHVVFVKDGWGGEMKVQESNDAEVVVEVWKKGPPPTFRVENVMGTQRSTAEVFLKVKHNLRQRPERVVVRLSPVDDFINETNPNGGFWFHAVGASQNPDTKGNFGGVIFAYNEKYVRLWAPSRRNVNSGCIFIGREWGGGINTQTVAKCRVEILIWVNQLPVPTFQSEWFEFKGQRNQDSFKEIYHGLNELPAFVNVQLRAVTGRNLGYVFEAQGATQTDDNGTNQYGGIVFAYNENHVHIWAPSEHDGSKKGYPLLVKHGWGGNSNLQSGSDSCLVRIVAYSSRCNGSRQVLYEGNKCVNTLYDSYRTKASAWSKCSSICNNGTRTRLLTGCDVRRKETVLKCDFENGMCGWSSSRQGGNALSWVLTNTATPEADTGPLWGHPKGSYYVYTDTRKAVPDQTVTLTSPNTGGADKCLLRFYWNMYGSDVGTLQVFVNTKDPRRHISKWVSSGWAMIGSQGDIFWRSAFVNLETFNKVYQIRFQHMLPEGNCNRDRNTPCTVCKNQRCPAANVAIDDIRLDCQIIQFEDKPEMCTKRTATCAGCEMTVTKPTVTGPAYSLQKIGDNVYVTAGGTKHELIAIYEFEVMFAADYVVWKQTFAKTNTTNDISFRIDDGDWLNWQLPYKVSHALWTQYYFQQFQLKPGVHRVSLRQVEYGFILSRLALVPAKINMWTDLGMQSRQIPDGLLTAFPFASNPKPRFGRLHAQDAWCSSDHNQGFVYFQVKLPELAMLSQISVQGGQDILQKENDYWIKSFRMKISLDGENYTWYRDTGGRKTFKANSDASSIVDHTLMFSALVRGIRVYPWAWRNWICLRLELYGFYMSSELCASAWPIETIKPCVGDRDCGQNAECRRLQASAIRKQVMENEQASLLTNITGQDNLEACHCFQGYHGSSCEHFGCTPNPCLNGGSCSQINTTFRCTCQPGHHGDTCQHPCLSGYYGKNCSQQCQCTEHGSCDAATGHCSCKLGYHGIDCDQICSEGYFGYNCSQRCQCKNGASCDKATGSCNCTLGWTGAVCDHPCPWNTWGVNCKLNCSCSTSASYCNRFTGECICSRGYFDRNCEHPCRVGFYGYNCTSKCLCQRNSTCSATDGTCKCTQPGWTGVLCDKPCPAGYYGVNCAQTCKCNNRAACDPVTGNCTCTSGWSGLFCDKPCAQGWWGRNCSIRCSCVNGALCDSVNGECSCSSANGCLCSPGWTGDDCAEPCPSGTWGPSCAKLCSCQQNGVCHQANGSCYCLPGYMGPKCNAPCPQGTYGLSCRHKCSCSSSTLLGCHPVDGTCKCVPGYMGPRCGIPCPAGGWGVNCSLSCLCIHGLCNQVSGNCTCDRGWRGIYCDQPCANCSRPCPTCYHGNGSCDTATGHCFCSPGYQGSSCLETCPLGYYGDKCRQMCNCANGGVCHHVTGQCVCKLGWTGPQCSNACPSGSYGHNCSQFCSCVHGTCNSTDGSCACDAGYRGYLCDRPCRRGWYGPRCSQECVCRNAAVCDHVTGRCTCRAGWTGKVCEVACDVALSSHGIFGAACLERCICPAGIACDAEHGTCLCPPGFQGPNCIEACPRGRYGVNCSYECDCLNNASCDHVLGTCTCTPGWSGANCSDHCPEGSFGLLCSETCECNAGVADVTHYCDPVTGKCSCGPGYQGYRCQERCREGSFGKNCRQLCACANGGVCNSIDGTCNCPPGYHGATCQLRCSSSRYGYNCSGTCQCVVAHTMSCDKVDGNCMCTTGHMGVFCENLCPEGLYGVKCLQQCTCRNGAACDHVTGACTCPPGFKGHSCEKSCNSSTFGRNCAQQCLCRNGASCNRFDGNCLCAAGFQGEQCTQECPGGRFGVGCQKNCDCNEANTQSCDKKTGACICHPGFKGGRCDELCEDGFYGDECKKPCPGCSRHVIGACNKITGNCTCAPGYREYYCLDDCPLDRYGLHCKNACTCSVNELCHHINGTCLNMLRGKFSIIVDDSLEELGSDIVRQRNIKRGLESLMKIYFDLSTKVISDNEVNVTQARLSLLDGNNSSSFRNPNPSDRVLPSEIPEVKGATDSASEKHEFMVRLLEFQTVVKEGGGQATRVICVLLDNYTVIDGHYVDEVLSRIPSEDVSRYLMVQYYTGRLQRGGDGSSSIAMHLPLIIGVSVGFSLIIIMLALFAIMRRRHRQKHILGSYRRGKKDQLEIELQPWIGRSTSYLLAFDNPYYDVLAAMGLDDDVEEDYYNPLYDDVSLYSDSGGNTSEDSSHKDLSAMVIRT